MTTWTDSELTRIADADELALTPRPADEPTGRSTTIWVVRAGDSLYVRSHGGRAGGWFRRALATGQARIRAGGVERDVSLVEPDTGVRAAIDQAYRTKYGHYGATYLDPMVSDSAAAATFRLTPR